MMYIIGLSYGMVASGIAIDSNVVRKSTNLLFIGGFISTLSWVQLYVIIMSIKAN